MKWQWSMEFGVENGKRDVPSVELRKGRSREGTNK
jgi:hypothetical protein